jgi:hypothetical protein
VGNDTWSKLEQAKQLMKGSNLITALLVLTNEPKDIHNHGFDALRYGIQAIDETPSKFQSFVSRTQLNLPR